MNKRPWMPLYVMEYLSDTAHLTPAESGAYIHLIIYYWVNGGLPSDDLAVARITRLNPKAWRRSRGTLKAFFGDLWTHHRIDQELAKVIEISNRNRANALRRHSHRTATADTLTLTHTKKDSVNGFEGSKKGKTEKGNGRIWVAEGTEQWKAWHDFYKKTKNISPPKITKNNEDGFWFESEFPQ